MTAPLRERRSAPDRRQYLPECAIDWAEAQLERGRSRRDVADQLQINRRTLDRRLADRQGPGLRVRCHCGAVTTERRCPNGHLIPLFLPIGGEARRAARST